jgi:hypothetical protein
VRGRGGDCAVPRSGWALAARSDTTRLSCPPPLAPARGWKPSVSSNGATDNAGAGRLASSRGAARSCLSRVGRVGRFCVRWLTALCQEALKLRKLSLSVGWALAERRPAMCSGYRGAGGSGCRTGHCQVGPAPRTLATPVPSSPRGGRKTTRGAAAEVPTWRTRRKVYSSVSPLQSVMIPSGTGVAQVTACNVLCLTIGGGADHSRPSRAESSSSACRTTRTHESFAAMVRSFSSERIPATSSAPGPSGTPSRSNSSGSSSCACHACS